VEVGGKLHCIWRVSGMGYCNWSLEQRLWEKEKTDKECNVGKGMVKQQGWMVFGFYSNYYGKPLEGFELGTT
jgi:hypothetical protein